MDVLARLKWQKAQNRFVAYPVGNLVAGRCAVVFCAKSSLNTDRNPFVVEESWHWSVHWDGWFSDSGYKDTKQGAADMATKRWWQMVQTDLPRNVDLEVYMIVARVLVCPMPNSLLGEDMAFLEKVIWHLKNVYEREISALNCPARSRR